MVLGSSGMLGKEVTRVLKAREFDVVPTVRSDQVMGDEVSFDFNSSTKDLQKFFSKIGQVDYVINCIGMIKQKFKPGSEMRDSIIVNSILPALLDASSTEYGFRVIQIATDCVYSGREGSYCESSYQDAIDLYGVTKSLGEVSSERFLNLRCSIIGEEFKTYFSLYNWLLSQPQNSLVNGYTDHYWNGLTTTSFARIVAGILAEGSFESGTKHLVPADTLTKYELLKVIAKLNDREDLVINAFESGTKIDRSLMTEFEEFNLQVWKTAGYEGKPTIEHMIQELVWVTKGAQVECK